MADFLQDLTYSIRTLRRSPGFAIVAVLALALGIGANTAIFSVVNSVLLRPLPYPHPDHLVMIWGRFTGIGIPKDHNWFSAPELEDVRAMNKSLSHIAAFTSTSFNVNLSGTPERIDGAVVSPDLFPMLGVQPRVGRTFLPEEAQPGRDRVALISFGLWKRRFGSDPSVVGRKVLMNAASYQVVGVLPPEFDFPPQTEIWAPLAFAAADLGPNNRGSHGYQVLARIKPELSMAQAHADMERVTHGIIDQNRDYPYARFNYALLLSPLLEETVGDIKTALWVLLGAVGFVLLIACANVANLLLVRASAREREIAIRTALGAGRARLIRQMLTESVILGVLGGVAGLLLARWGLRTLIAVSEASFPRVAGTTIDGQVLAFTILVSLATGLIFGLAPAWQASRSVTHESLKEGSRSNTGGTGSQRLRRVLIASEIALSLVLLAGAGLLLKSFLKLQQIDPGFRPEHVLTMRTSLPQERYATQDQIRNFYRDVLTRVRALPGVEAAGAISALPLSGQGGSGTTTVDTQSVPQDKRGPEADQRPVMPGYFEAMGIPLVRGRYFDDHDNEHSAPVAIIDETMAQTYWPNQDAVGQRLHRGGFGSPAPWMTIVGVVRHVRSRTLEAQSRVEVFWPETQNPYSSLSFAIRTGPEPMSLAGAVQKQILAVDPDQPVYRIRTMPELMSNSLARRRLSMLFLAIFAGAALALASVGIYGITSYSVAQRAQEMGVRMALGASRAGILRLVLGQSLAIALAGVAVGLVGSFALTGLMSSLLFNVRASDPWTFAAVAAVLIAVTMLASYIPAWKATRVDPMIALRYE
jgi:predicted permease